MATILHVDMDAFFASVEQRDNPEYRGKPVIVGAPPDKRGVVSTCSYEARKYGVHSAMPSREAARLCPNGIFLPGNQHRYSEVSASVMEILERFTPLVEQVSIDEAYLDVTGSQHLFGDGTTIAKAIRSAIHDELDLAASVGVAPNKFVSKICSELAKPDGLKTAPFEATAVAKFLAPLDIGVLPGIGKVAKERLLKFGYRRVKDLQQATPTAIEAIMGKHFASYIMDAAFGNDDRPVAPPREELSISREYTFEVDTSDREAIREKLHELSDDVGYRLRASGKWATEAKLKLRWSDFSTITRQKQISRAIKDDFSLFEEALALFNREKLIAPVRLIGFGVGGLSDGEAQQELDLFGTSHGSGGNDLERKERLSDAVDAIRKKLGYDALKHL